MMDIHITDRLQALKDNDTIVIGCFPLYPPLELSHSLGIIPLVLWGLRDIVKDVVLLIDSLEKPLHAPFRI